MTDTVQTSPGSPALRWSRILIKLLMVLNIAGGVILIACFAASFVLHDLVVDMLRSNRSPLDTDLFIPAVRVWMVLTLPAIAALHILFRRTLELLATVQVGSPFVAENAARLRTMAWCLVIVQATQLVHGVMSAVAEAAHADMDWDFSPVGWLCVLLLFVLARVFEEGARMRDDLEAMI